MRYFRAIILALASIAMLVAGTLTAAEKVDDIQLARIGDGAPFKLSEHKTEFVALHFLLKTECPYCIKHTNEYATRMAEVPSVTHIFIKPDTPEEIAKWMTKLGNQIPVYRDPDAALADKFKIPGGYKFHGQEVHYPALIILDADEKEVFRYIGKSNSDRLSFDNFKKEMAKLRPDVDQKNYNLKGGVALDGYDPVSYFDGKPQRGAVDLTAKYRGVIYRFTSAGNLAKFSANPDNYTPAYGGWCAMMMANGNKVEAEPTYYKITNGRLFLFHKTADGDTISEWSKDEVNLITKADAAWKQIETE